MVSRRNYFSIAVIMLILFFMFQFTNVALEAWNDYDTNEYAVDVTSLSVKSSAYNAADSELLENSWGEKRRMAVYIGGEEAIGKAVSSWATYTKWSVKSYRSLNQYEAEKSAAGAAAPKMIVLDAASIDWEDSSACEYLEKYTSSGIHLVFASLPEASVIGKNKRLQELLGIQEIRSANVTAEGVHLYKNFLLGGEIVYQTKAEDEKQNRKLQDMELRFPWYILSPGTKAYMRGILEDDSVEPEDQPALVWRNSIGGAYIFAVNGTYMEDATALGFLSAMVKEMEAYTIYPVVNAQNLVLANYPGLASENGKEMERYYSRSMRDVYRDIVWPDIVSIYKQSHIGLSCMIAPQLDYKDSYQPNQVQFIYYMKLLNEQAAEAGLSGGSISPLPIEEKLAEDFRFMEGADLEYSFTSFYAGSLSETDILNALGFPGLSTIRTVVTEYNGESDIIGYQTENVTRQSTLTDGLNHTFMQDLRVRSIETSLAYTSILVDMRRVAYPESEEDTWNIVSERLKTDLPFYWKEFTSFEGASVTECDGRIRSFLSLDYMDTFSENTISLKTSGSDTPVWFILRLNSGEIAQIEGGSFHQIGDTEAAYLIEARQQEVTIRLKNTETIALN